MSVTPIKGLVTVLLLYQANITILTQVIATLQNNSNNNKHATSNTYITMHITTTVNNHNNGHCYFNHKQCFLDK